MPGQLVNYRGWQSCSQRSDVTVFYAQYVAGEPPERTAARARRLAEKQAKMAAAAAEMAARDTAADDEKAAKVTIREQLKPRMEAWHKGKQVRALAIRRVQSAICSSGRL